VRRALHAVFAADSQNWNPNSGNYIGTAGALKRVLSRMLVLHKRTLDFDDQTLLSVSLLCNRSAGSSTPRRSCSTR